MLTKILAVFVITLILESLIIFTLIFISINSDNFLYEKIITNLVMVAIVTGFIAYILSIIVKAKNEN